MSAMRDLIWIDRVIYTWAGTEFFELLGLYLVYSLEMVDLYLENGLWIAGCSGEEIVYVFWNTEIFKSIEICLQDGSEMTIHQWNWERLHIYCTGLLKLMWKFYFEDCLEMAVH